MYNVLKLFGICFLFCFCSFKNTGKGKADRTSPDLESSCEIPLEVEEYLMENTNTWSRLDLNDFNKELVSYLFDSINQENRQVCPYFVYGDFTNNGKEDFAIILKNTKEEIDGNGNYMFPYLLIFNDFKENIEPHIVYKTGLYKDEYVKTVIYSDEEHGVSSYLRKGNVCGTNVIDIIYFEKSSFFVYWDNENKTYQFLNYLDENLCEKVVNVKNDLISLKGKWSNDCNSELTDFDVNEKSEVFLSLASDNSIYINCLLVPDLNDADTYNLFFDNVDSQKYHYEDKKNIIGTDISKKESIAIIRIISSEAIEIEWIGLYNLKTRELEFNEDFLFFKENDNLSPILLNKCDS